MITGPVTAPAATRGSGAGPAPAYAAIMVTPGHGVQWQSDFSHKAAGSTDPAPRWLKLTRAGSRVTGYESADGVTWTQVGTTDVTDLPATALVGLFVTSPPTGVKSIRRSPTSTESSPDYTLSTAVFDSVRLTGADGEPVTGSWQHLDTNGPPRELPHDNVAGSFTEDAGRFTVSGAGDLGVQPPGAGGDNDVVRDSLFGILDRVHRDGGHRRLVHHHRVPSRHHPYDVHRDPASRAGSRRQGRRPRGDRLRDRRRGSRAGVPDQPASPAGERLRPARVPEGLARRTVRWPGPSSARGWCWPCSRSSRSPSVPCCAPAQPPSRWSSPSSCCR